MLDFADTAIDTPVDLGASSVKIQQLIKWLTQNKFDANKFKALISTLNLSPADFHSHYRFSAETYTRNTIFQSEDVEMILICWDVGQLSPVHNHSFSQCFVHCLEGSICENSYVYQNNEMVFGETSTLAAGDSTFIHNLDVYHEFGNASNTAKAVTLHLYAPKIVGHHFFDKATRTIKKCEL